MAVSATGGVTRADMVTVRGESVGVAGGGGGASGGGGGGGVTEDSAATTTTTTLTHPAHCHPNGTPTGTPNGDAQWKPLPHEASKMAKIRDVVEGAAR